MSHKLQNMIADGIIKLIDCASWVLDNPIGTAVMFLIGMAAGLLCVL